MSVFTGFRLVQRTQPVLHFVFADDHVDAVSYEIDPYAFNLLGRRSDGQSIADAE